ncbi:MAG: flagellar basal body P-ring formation protein FlgA [Zetaproteobacteria bacterium]|nr:flagellar basal body P-ring formation protein FlgA [Zetaproteobacteria bacterium]
MLRNYVFGLWMVLFSPYAALAAITIHPQALSIQSAFDAGMEQDGVLAHLEEIYQLPTTNKALRWEFPYFRGHPSRVSMVGTANDGSRWFMSVRLRWSADVVVASHRLSAHTFVTTQDVVLAKNVDVTDHQGDFWTRIEDVENLRLTTPLGEGDLITTRNTTRPPLLKRGDQVSIIMKIGGLEVRATGVVMRNAQKGDRVDVKNSRSGKVVQARVLSADEVLILGRGM